MENFIEMINMEWYEMLDWDSISEDCWNKTSPSIKKKVRELGLAPKYDMKTCDICNNKKPDVRYADLLNKWICSDCMGVQEFSE